MSAIKKRSGNRGETRLATRTLKGDPMEAYDRLPAELRAWVREAALPWSPRSCLKIWTEARRAGQDTATIHARLSQAEARMLAKTSQLT